MAARRVFLSSVLLLSFACFSSRPKPIFGWKYSSSVSESQLTSPVYFGGNYLLKSKPSLPGLVRHLASVPRGKSYLGSRICYYANSDNTFQQLRLLKSGDISLNPGPNSSSKCSVCTKTIARNHRALSCDQCDMWCHIKCGKVKPNDYKNLQHLTFFNWICPRCLQSTNTIERNEPTLTTPVSNVVNSTGEDPLLSLKQIVGDKNLKIGHLNINGLLNKLPEVKNLLNVVNFDLFGITETHLNSSTSDDWIRISGYNFARKDRTSCGGGVLIYFKEDLTVYPVNIWDGSVLEATWLNVTIRSQTFLVGCIYRPPNDFSFFDHFRGLIADIWMKRKNIILIGDFNCDMMRNSDNSESDNGKRLLRIINSCGLTNIINTPTRITANSKSLIDLVITSQPSKTYISGSIDLGISDHHLTFAIFKAARSKALPKIISAKNYKLLDVNQLKSDFDQAPWHVSEIFDDIDDCVAFWQCLYDDILHHHLPSRDAKIRDKSLPWINTSIRKEMNKRYKLLKDAKLSGDPEKWRLYKEKRNAIKKQLKRAETAYWQTSFEEASNPREFWRLTNQVLRKHKTKSIGPISGPNEVILTHSLAKAEYFNDFFVNISEDLTKQLDPLDIPSLNSFITRITPIKDTVDFSWKLVRDKLIKAAKPMKATGPDNVSPRVLSLVGDSVIHSLLPVFNRSLSDSSFPSKWKLSRVNPIFKKGPPTDVNNYRPISLLSVPGKVLEDVVCDTLSNHLELHGLLSQRQWGFRKNYSTESLLLHLTETWKTALDNSLKVGVLFIDFRKAFDTVNHTILLEKLNATGISGDLFSWLTDYLSRRQQFVQISGNKSELKKVRFGVPQGSILGPKLFSIFVNDLAESITHGELYLFADDTTIYTLGENIDDIIPTLQSILDQVHTWCLSNRLVIHEFKSEAMIISNQTFVGPLPCLRYGNSLIEYKVSSKCLGLTIDNRLSWQQHTKNVCASFSKKVAVLKRIKFLPKPVLQTIYYRTILPSVLYGIVVWGSCSPSLLEDIDRIHLRATKIIYSLPRDIHSTDVRNLPLWTPIIQFYIKRLLTISFNIYNDTCIDPLRDLIVRSTSNYNLRKFANLEVPSPRTEIGRSSFKHRAALCWNLLPNSCKRSSSLGYFKKFLKENKNFLNSISFDKASCIVSFKSPDFKYF